MLRKTSTSLTSSPLKPTGTPLCSPPTKNFRTQKKTDPYPDLAPNPKSEGNIEPLCPDAREDGEDGGEGGEGGDREDRGGVTGEMAYNFPQNSNLKISDPSNPRHFWKKTPGTVKSNDVLREIKIDEGLRSEINIFEPNCELDSPKAPYDSPKYNLQLLSTDFSLDSDMMKSNLASQRGSPKKLAILKKIYNRMFAANDSGPDYFGKDSPKSQYGKDSVKTQIGLVDIKPWSGVENPNPELFQNTTAKKTPILVQDSGEEPNLSTADSFCLTAKKTTIEPEGFGIERENFQLQFQLLEHIRRSSKHLLRSPDKDLADLTIITQEDDNLTITTQEDDLTPDTPTLLPKKIQYDLPSLKTSLEQLTIKKQPQYPNPESDSEPHPQDKLESDLNLTNFELDLSKISPTKISSSAPNFYFQSPPTNSQNRPSEITSSEFDIDGEEFEISEIDPITSNAVLKKSLTPVGSPLSYPQEDQGTRPHTARAHVSAHRSSRLDDSICQEDISYTLDMIKKG